MTRALSDQEALETIRQLKNEGKKVVFTNGCFDILHAGHTFYLNEAKSLGDFLVVGLNSDRSVKAIKSSDRPINSQVDRASVLAALRSVDLVVIFDEETPIRLIELLKPDVYVKGGDYTLATLPEAPIVQAYGGIVEIVSFVPGKSTTNILNAMKKGQG